MNMWRNKIDRVGLGLRMILLCQPQDRRSRHQNMSNATLSDVEIAHGQSLVPLHD